MPIADLEVCESANESWRAVRNQLTSVVNSSQVGEALFGEHMEDVSADLVRAVVDANAKEFGTTSPMTAAGISFSMMPSILTTAPFPRPDPDAAEIEGIMTQLHKTFQSWHSACILF